MTHPAQKALNIIAECGARTRLTVFGNSLVSRYAAGLLARGLIARDPARWVGYRVTKAGLAQIVAARPDADVEPD